jgi:biopolymer transport protein ExbD
LRLYALPRAPPQTAHNWGGAWRLQREKTIMAMLVKAAAGEPSSEIDITPLIDVMLVLLTMLIVTLPMRMHAVNLGLPAEPRLIDMPVIDAVEVQFDGTMMWNGRAVDRAGLDRYLVADAAQSPQHLIHVRADRLARYDTVAKVMADAQRLGIKDIGIVGTDSYAR